MRKKKAGVITDRTVQAINAQHCGRVKLRGTQLHVNVHNIYSPLASCKLDNFVASFKGWSTKIS